MATLNASPYRARSRDRFHRARGARPPARSPAAAGDPLRPGGPDLRAGRPPPALDRADAAAPADQGAAAAAGSVDSARVHRRGRRRRPGRLDVRASARPSPPLWLARRSLAAAGGASSATAAALTTILIRSMLMTKLKIASAGILGRDHSSRRPALSRSEPCGPTSPSPRSRPPRATVVAKVVASNRARRCDT